MKKYRCTLCGYIYDEEIEKVKFEDLPEDWICPLCGAPKALFELIEEKDVSISNIDDREVVSETVDELRTLTNLELSLICSNLARGCEKQYLEEEKQLFLELSQYYEKRSQNLEGTLSDVKEMNIKDLDYLNQAMNIASKFQDRGAKRILTWATKSSNIMKIILDNYEKKGIEYLKHTKIWVCDICGFVFVGDVPPEVCPVCKVPNFKILEVK